jgi:uncharacterized membrane-anchored protein YjiN (DUF445 family)
VQEAPTSWLDRLKARLGNTPLAQRIAALQESETARRMAEGYQDIKQKLDTDSEVMGRVSDMREQLMAESEAAVAYREIRMRHPNFDMPSFLRAIKSDVPSVIKVRYLETSFIRIGAGVH